MRSQHRSHARPTKTVRLGVSLLVLTAPFLARTGYAGMKPTAAQKAMIKDWVGKSTLLRRRLHAFIEQVPTRKGSLSLDWMRQLKARPEFKDYRKIQELRNLVQGSRNGTLSSFQMNAPSFVITIASKDAERRLKKAERSFTEKYGHDVETFEREVLAKQDDSFKSRAQEIEQKKGEFSEMEHLIKRRTDLSQPSFDGAALSYLFDFSPQERHELAQEIRNAERLPLAKGSEVDATIQSLAQQLASSPIGRWKGLYRYNHSAPLLGQDDKGLYVLNEAFEPVSGPYDPSVVIRDLREYIDHVQGQFGFDFEEENVEWGNTPPKRSNYDNLLVTEAVQPGGKSQTVLLDRRTGKELHRYPRNSLILKWNQLFLHEPGTSGVQLLDGDGAIQHTNVSDGWFFKIFFDGKKLYGEVAHGFEGPPTRHELPVK